MSFNLFPSSIALPALLAIGLSLQPSLASARENTSSERASAESLFQDGRRLMEAKEYVKASQAFEASQDLDPGAGTLLNLARAYELSGKIASAWSTFAEAEGLAQQKGDSPRSQIARRQRERIEPLVPYVIIEVRGLSEGAQLKLDEKPLSHRALNLKLATDPGEHLLEVHQEGKKKIEHSFEVPPRRASDNEPIIVRVGPAAVLDVEVVAPSEQRDASSPSSDTPSTVVRKPQSVRESQSAWKTAGIVTSVIGGVGFGVGTTLVLQSYDKAARAECTDDVCSPGGLRDRASARKSLPAAYF